MKQDTSWNETRHFIMQCAVALTKHYWSCCNVINQNKILTIKTEPTVVVTSAKATYDVADMCISGQTDAC